MKIALITPLYPPDVAEPAPYVKELARRLAAAGDEVVVVTYGRLPEEVPGVRIVAIDKRRALPIRLWAYTRALRVAAHEVDAVYAQNGASVELPLVVARPRRLFARFGDEAAHARAAGSFLRRRLERLAFNRARIVASAPGQRPEILPFAQRPEAALAAWEAAWSTHLKDVRTLFNHAR